MSYNLLPAELKKSRLIEKMLMVLIIVLVASAAFIFLLVYRHINCEADAKVWEIKEKAAAEKSEKLKRKLNNNPLFNSLKDGNKSLEIAQRVKLDYKRYDYILSLIGDLTPGGVLINKIRSNSNEGSIELEGQAKEYQSLVNFHEILSNTEGIFDAAYQSIVYDNKINVINFKIKFFLK